MTKPYEAAVAGKGLRILIAEDDIDDQEILGETLHKLHPAAEVVMVSTGLKALRVLEGTPDDQLPDLVILDYNMPELNGEQLLEALWAHSRYTRIYKVVLSTSSSPYYRSACLALGAQGYHTKPSSFPELEALITLVLAASTAYRA